MSSKTPTSNNGISKSAAKKKAKKAAKAAQTGPQIDLATGEVQVELGSGVIPGAIDPNLFNFAAGSYPVDLHCDSGTYYEEGDTVHQSHPPFSLPFPFDYNLPAPGPQQNGNNIAGLPINITNEDLIQTAHELYRRMADPNFGSDDAYWASLPTHIRQFIRDALPLSGQNDTNSAQRSMYNMAQQIVSAASQGMGFSSGVGANIMAQMNGRQYPQPGLGEDLGFHRHPDAKEDEYDDEEDFDIDEPDFSAANGDVPKKKNKKKKKKSAAATEPPPAPLPPPAVKQPPRQPIPSQPVPQPTLNPPPPPTAPIPSHPPPSSRAAGKQPMTTVPATSANPPTRSARAAGKAPAGTAPAHNHAGHHNHPPPAKPAAKGKAPASQPPAKIWTQSSAQDRDNIRRFWLELNERDRRDLLQIEKEAVLRKMKEQHRHSCGCAVCGRKKVNIEMELDQLYEQYYDELRTYAADQRGPNARPPELAAGPFPGSVEVDATGQVTKLDHRAPDPPANPPDEIIGDEVSEDYDDEEYDEEEEMDDEDIGSDEADAGDDLDDNPQLQQPATRPIKPAPKKAITPRVEGAEDFSSFGNHLTTIKGGILTVADDLLKNDGSKFLEMMEQLAVARSVREEQNYRDLQEETDDESYDYAQDDHIDEGERIEEGKRMFQIFAARMFEKRVLDAYKDKVTQQRQDQLLRELDDEEEDKKAQAEKKAKEAQKKKDKKKQQKQKLEEEKSAREAAIAAEQQATKAKAEEAERERQKKQEEERIRRDSQKKAAYEEQQRQQAERKKRQQEEKEREEEAAKKKREREEKARKEREAREKEAKDREKREKDEKLAREKAEKERVALEKAEKAERDRLAKEAREIAEKERLARLEEERIEKALRDELARKEREAAEHSRLLAAQQAQRERAKAEAAAAAAAAEKDRLERAAAEKAAPRPAAPIPIRAKTAVRNGIMPQTTPPFDQPSSSAIRPPTSVRTQKTPQPYFPQPMPTVAAFSNRMPMPQALAPGFRPAYPAPQAVFSPPQQANGSHISPNPPTRSFQPEPSPPFELRTAPIGMGFPPVKQNRMSSVDDAFALPSAPIGMSSSGSRNPSGELGLYDDYRRPIDHTSPPAPIGPPSRLEPIGRPSAFLDPPTSSTSTHRSKSPAPPEKVYGSAALGGDDEEIVQPQPQLRGVSSGWGSIPVTAAPGTGRWSSSIWSQPSTTEPHSDASTWGAPVPPGGNRQSSFGFGGVVGQGNPFPNMGPGPPLFSPPGQLPHHAHSHTHSHH